MIRLTIAIATVLVACCPTAGKELSALELRGHDRHVFALALTSDGKYLVSGGEAPYLIVWDTSDGSIATRIIRHGPQQNAGPVRNLEISQDGKLVGALTAGQRIQFWDIATGKEVDRSYSLDAPTVRWALSADGTLLASGGAQDVSVTNTSHGAVHWEHSYPANDVGSVTALNFSPDGKRLVIGLDYSGGPRTTQTTKHLQVLNLHSKSIEFAAWPETLPVVSAEFTPDGKHLVAGSAVLECWDCNGFSLQFTKNSKDIANPKHFPICCLSLDSSSTQIATGGNDGSVVVWSADGSLQHTLAGLSEHVTAVSLSGDGKKLAAVDFSGLIRLWTLR